MNDKFKYILQLQEQGLTRHEIKDKLGYKRLDSMTKFMSNRGYKVVNDRYIPIDDKGMTSISESSKDVKKSIQQDIVLSDDKGMTIDIQQDLKANIISLANDYDKIQEVLKWFNNKCDDKGMTEVIEVVSQGIKINLPKSEIIRTTIRINKDTWDKFDKFAQEHKEFNKQDLMAQALEEYMNNFK